jgi:hypothetical protein
VTTTRTWLHDLRQRIFPPRIVEPTNGTNPPSNPGVVVAIYKERGRWRIIDKDAKMPGRDVYLIVMGQKQLDEYVVIRMADQRIQRSLQSADKEFRPRAVSRAASIPDLGTQPVEREQV